jgi:DNA-binding NarL/FixJ family response regulator
VVHWNPAFRAAVEEAAGGRGLAAAAERLAVRAVRVARGECLAPGDGLSTTLELGERTETVRASPIVAGTFAHTACAIVTVDRVRVVIPDAEALREAYGLTPRQGEVARLVALGWTTPRIARRLAISPHTARHHVEAVLERMNLHSRKALGLRILQDFAAGA